MTLAQKSAMHRLGKADGAWRVERMVTGRALIRLGYARPVRMPLAPVKGIAVELTPAGRTWLAAYAKG